MQGNGHMSGNGNGVAGCATANGNGNGRGHGPACDVGGDRVTAARTSSAADADATDATDATDAPVFVIGSPRSGTTWVQRLLVAHPAVCGGQESHFFAAFGPPLR